MSRGDAKGGTKSDQLLSPFFTLLVCAVCVCAPCAKREGEKER